LKQIAYKDMRYYTAEMNVKHGIFTRHGGASQVPFNSLNVGGTVGDDLQAVRQNHQLMYEALDVLGERAVTTWQVHGADVVMAHQPVANRKWLAKADGIITKQPDTPLVMRFADCTPLLYFDPVQRAIGIAHAGWRGTVQGMASAMVKAMQMAYNTNPADLIVTIGPSISQKCFQVGEEVVQALEDYFGQDHNLVQRDASDGTAYVDLWRANQLDLQRLGVENIEIMGICTHQAIDEFYSHRAEKGKTGRFGAVISL
jgi:polyphenol oxidase